MTEVWSTYMEFTVWVGTIVVLACIAWWITKKYFGDFNEHEAVSNAEWIIMDHCRSQKLCEECDKYIKQEESCMYKCLHPWRWKEGYDYDVSGEGRNTEEVQGRYEDGEVLSVGDSTISGDIRTGEDSEIIRYANITRE